MNNAILINKFSDYLKKKGKSKSTLVAYAKDIDQFLINLKGKKISDITENDINNFIQKLKTSGDFTLKTISRKLNSIRTFFRFASETGNLNENPALKIRHPKFIQEKPKYLSQGDYNKLKTLCKENEKIFLMIELLLQTGMRISELASLKFSDVNLDRRNPSIKIRESNSQPERIIPLNDKAFYVLKDFISNNKPKTYLLTTKNNKPIEIRNIRASIDRVFAKSKLKQYCVNDLRNTFIVSQLAQGMSTSRLAEIVGHRTENATQRYIEILPKKYKNKNSIQVCEL